MRLFSIGLATCSPPPCSHLPPTASPQLCLPPDCDFLEGRTWDWGIMHAEFDNVLGWGEPSPSWEVVCW